jgi:CheY-like chemotaxis protein/AraC-like DNA-binding protein
MFSKLKRESYHKRITGVIMFALGTISCSAQSNNEESSGTNALLIILFIIIVLLLAFYSLWSRKKLKDRIQKLEKEVVEKQKEAEDAITEKREGGLILRRVTSLFLKNMLQLVEEVLPPLKDINERPSLPSNFPNVQNLYRNAILIKATGEQLEEINEEQIEESNNKIEIAPYSIQKILYEVNQKLSDVIDTNQIIYRFSKFARPELKVYVNKEKLIFILKNLLMNAFNHIQHRGMVSLTVSEEVSDDDCICSIDISYSAKLPIKRVNELAAEECSVFDINAIELGYEYMENAISKIGGKITFKSEEGATNIVLSIPTIVEKIQNLDAVKLITIPEDKDIDEHPATEEQKKEGKESKEAKISNALESRNESEFEGQVEILENGGSQQKSKNTILIISDRQEIVMYMKVLLSTTYNIITASTGQEGIERARNDKPDMIMCDVEVPGTGFHVCEEIRGDVSTCHLPFILVTSKVEDDDLVRGLEIGADDYMLKPFTPGIIKAKIENLIKNRKVLRQKYSNLMVQLNGRDDEGLEDGGSNKNSFMTEIVKLIEDNILEPDFSVKKLASAMNMSQPTLYRKVKQQTNCTIIELIIGVRIRRAAMFLKEGKYSVQEVAEKVGYNDVSTFRKNFVEIMGSTPSTYSNGQ